MDHVEGMFDALERKVAPCMLDCSLLALDDGFTKLQSQLPAARPGVAAAV